MSEDQVPKYKTFAPISDDDWQSLDIAHGDTRRTRPALPPAKPWETNPEPQWEAVFRRATTGEVEFFERHAMKDGTKDAAYRNLAKATIVGVSFGGKVTICADRNDRRQVDVVRAEWERLRGAYGGAHLAAVDDLNSLMSAVKDESGKG